MKKPWWEKRGMREVEPSEADYERMMHRLIIDITYECNLGCINCNTACGIAPTTDHMTVAQIQKFVQESDEHKWQWDGILLEGGEPTLHPDLFQIIDTLKTSPSIGRLGVLGITTNGYGEGFPERLQLLKKRYPALYIRNTAKTGRHVKDHECFYVSPRDVGMEAAQWERGCSMPFRCGLALTPYGFYPCSQGAAIDRLFDTDLGVKSFKDVVDWGPKRLLEYWLNNALCADCGRLHAAISPYELVSDRWAAALFRLHTRGVGIPCCW